jgi:hypothetical protein
MPVDRVLVMVIGYIAALDEVERILAGWPDEMGKPDGISWVAERLRSASVPPARPPGS